jgi:hypothetical protein
MYSARTGAWSRKRGTLTETEAWLDVNHTEAVPRPTSGSGSAEKSSEVLKLYLSLPTLLLFPEPLAYPLRLDAWPTSAELSGRRRRREGPASTAIGALIAARRRGALHAERAAWKGVGVVIGSNGGVGERRSTQIYLCSQFGHNEALAEQLIRLVTDLIHVRAVS